MILTLQQRKHIAAGKRRVCAAAGFAKDILSNSIKITNYGTIYKSL